MRRHVGFAVALVLISASPALGRQAAPDVAQPVPEAGAEPEMNVREAALQTLADAFARQTRAVTEQINAALDAGGEEAEIRARIDAILVPFERQAGSFSEEVAGFIRWQADQAETPEARDEVLSAIGPVVEAIVGLPIQLRTRANTAIAARAEAAGATVP